MPNNGNALIKQSIDSFADSKVFSLRNSSLGPRDYRVGLCGYFCSLMKNQSSVFLHSSQTEEDYIPYPSVHEVG